MAIDFPNSPSVNQVFTSGSKSWIWNGTSWAGNNNAGFVGSQGYAGSLGYSGSIGYTGSTPAIGGANTQVQFNSSGSLGGSSSLTWNGTTLTAGNISSSGTLAVTGATTQTGVLNLNSVMVEAYSNVSISTNTLTLNLSTAGIFNVTLNANITTLTLSSYPSGAGQAASFILMLTGDGTARTITWPASFRWPGATAPTPTSTLNQRDVYAFFTLDGGTNWQAFVSGQNL